MAHTLTWIMSACNVYGYNYIDLVSLAPFSAAPVQHAFCIKIACKGNTGFEMRFAIGSQHLLCRGSQRSQTKHVSNPDSVIHMFKPHVVYAGVAMDQETAAAGRSASVPF